MVFATSARDLTKHLLQQGVWPSFWNRHADVTSGNTMTSRVQFGAADCEDIQCELFNDEAGWQLGFLRNDDMQPHVTLSRLGHCRDCCHLCDVIFNILGELTLNEVIAIIERCV